MDTVRDLMTEQVLHVMPSRPLIEAAAILSKYNLTALPVLDEKGVLVGLLSEKNLVLESSYLNLKTLFDLFSTVDFYKKENQPIKENLKKILNLKVSDVMDPSPMTVEPNVSVEEVTRLFSQHKDMPLPVVDSDKRLVGIIALADLLKPYGVNTRKKLKSAEIDREVATLIKNFESRFVLVTKFRTRTWLITSIIFAVVGFLIAVFWIIRITT